VDGPGDPERIALAAGQYMISEIVDTGANEMTLEYNKYDAGDAVTISWRTAANAAALDAMADGDNWTEYVGHFTSLGCVQVRVEN